MVVLIFATIRSSLSLEISSTFPGGGGGRRVELTGGNTERATPDGSNKLLLTTSGKEI